MKKSLKITLLTLAIILALFGIRSIFLRKHDSTSLKVQTEAVKRGDILTTVTATGTVEPLVTVEVGTQVSGIIDKVYVDYSSVVKKGQLLAKLDVSTLKTSLVSARASFESAKNELDYQKNNYERINQLYNHQSVSKTDYETALYQYNNAKYSFKRTEQDLEKAQTNLGYAYIYFPIDGVVLSRAVDEGQTVAASFSTPTMFTIAKDLRQMRVIADVDEADIGNVRAGQNVMFTVDAFPDDQFTGTVTMVRLEAKTSSNVVTYEVVINAPNPSLKLLPGLTANVNIYTREKRGVLLIPSKAQRVQLTPSILEKLNIKVKKGAENNVGFTENTAAQTTGGQTASGLSQKTIWVRNNDGSLSQRKITIGISDGVSTEVLYGLKEGENVVTEISQSALSHKSADSTDKTESPFMPKRPGQKSSKK